MECRASIVIPAHNEEHRIPGLLRSLSEASEKDRYAIFVVCNGCTDRTREVAEGFDGIRVVEIDDVGKHYALNEGDRLAGDIFPRLYLDADVRLDASSLAQLVEALNVDGTVAAGPRVRYDVENSSWGIKRYYQALEVPIMTKWLDLHLMGRGVYGASREARRQFGAFPPLFADDKYFDSQYDESEKTVVAGALATIWTPATIRELIRNEARVAIGNRQLAEYRSEDQLQGTARPSAEERVRHGASQRFRTVKQWTKDVRFPDVIPLATYLSVAGLTRVYLAVLKFRQKQVSWR